MTFAEYAVSKVHSGKTNILLKSEGGTGKTYSLLETYDQIYRKPYYNDICFAPVFISLKDLTDKSLKQLILDNSNLMPATGDDVTAQFELLYRNVFSTGNKDHHTVLFMDGANEAKLNDANIKTVRDLSDCSDLSIIVSSRVDLPSAYDWTDFDTVTLAPIDEQTVERYAPEAEGTIKKLLTIPFYMELYLRSEKDPLIMKSMSSYSFIDAFFETNKKKTTNPTGDSSDYELILRILSEISFFATKNNALSFSVNNSEVESILTRYGIEKDRFISLLQLLIDLNVVSRTDEFIFEMKHEIYRDFLAAKYYIRSVKEYRLAVDDSFLSSSTTVVNEFISQGLFGKDICSNLETGEVYIGKDEIEEAFFRDADSPGKMLVSAGNLDFLIYNLKEQFSNGSAEKIIFGSEMSEILEHFWGRIKAAMKTSGSKTIPLSLKNYIESYSELLRRAFRFDKSRTVLEYLGSISPNYRSAMIHGIAKVDLYESFSLIKESDSGDVYDMTEKTMDTLAHNDYLLSQNLYAFLLSVPVLSLDQSVGEYVGKRGILRYKSAAEAYLKSARMAVDQKILQAERYPLQQIAWLLIHKKIGITSEEPILDVDSLLFDDSVRFTEDPVQVSASNSSKLADAIILALLRKRETESLHLLHALSVIYEGGILSKKDLIAEELSQSGGELLSQFIDLLYKGGAADTGRLNRILDKLTEMADRCMPDSEHPVYIAEEMVRLYEMFISYDFSYTEHFTGLIDKLKRLFR